MKNMTTRNPSPGRPREFDIEVALDHAIEVFRERGYQASSIAQISAATGLTTGSLYKAFEDKKDIFTQALLRYVDRRTAVLMDALRDVSGGLAKVETAVAFYAEASLAEEGQRGCMLVNAATECTAIGDQDLIVRVRKALSQVEALLSDLIREGQCDGSISGTVDRDASARLMMCLFQGIRVVGAAGLPELSVRPLVREVVDSLK